MKQVLASLKLKVSLPVAAGLFVVLALATGAAPRVIDQAHAKPAYRLSERDFRSVPSNLANNITGCNDFASWPEM